ncbi:MAG: hypothetical protein NT001_05360 [Candidatus Woesearchaeota archaeon]|nr:hypothetical protein [Candidatus Woesearchaeota archaeon]
MEAEKLKEHVDKAKEAVKDLEEPLKSKAFEIILNKLLTGSINTHQPLTESQNPPHKTQEIIYDADIADTLANTINSTKYPIMYKLTKALDRALYLLYLVRYDHKVDGLNPSQISKILSVKFRIPSSSSAIGMALMKAGSFVDRRSVNTTGGNAYQYSIMHEGENYIKRILENPPAENAKISAKSNIKKTINRSSKKPKSGLKERLMSLKEEGYFSTPREASEVQVELKDKGHNYNYDPVAVALLRLVKKLQLRRIKEIKGQKNIYKYCTP